MASEFITAIQPWKLTSEGIVKNNSSVAENTVSSFKNIFSDMVQNAEKAERNLENAEYLLATGQVDDAHTVPIAAAEAQLSIDLLVALRNKAVDAYNELMRISL